MRGRPITTKYEQPIQLKKNEIIEVNECFIERQLGDRMSA